MRLVVYGSPAPQGSKKFLGRTSQGRGIIVDSSPSTKPWRADVKDAAETYIAQRGGWEMFSGPLQLRLVFSFLRPVSATRRKRPYPSVYPDLSKLARSTEDALKAAGVYKDDALIVEYSRLAKVYCSEDMEALDRPGCLVVITEKVPEPIPLVSTVARLALEAA